MIRRIITLTVILFTLVNCEKEPEPKEFPIIKTHKPIDIDVAGATFGGELVVNGEYPISRYGFVWGVQELDTVIFAGPIPQSTFQYRANSLFIKNTQYKVRVFAQYNNTTVYGNTVFFRR